MVKRIDASLKYSSIKIESEKFDRKKLTADFVRSINHVCKN
ncbi:MAG: hypothetical protein JWP29_5709 [Rhodoferax sp.]|nr:hypothetical protein [Rhodoferax sp.]